MSNTVLPTFIYGTAWKKLQTQTLTKQALDLGFRAIDTANQLKHYYELEVGEALSQFFAEGNSRESVFVQTKFTSLAGQDQRLPYERDADLQTQVRQSFDSSLEHLHLDYLDSYLLHGPDGYPGLSPDDWEVWTAIEDLYAEGSIRHIGVSNMNPLQMNQLLERAKTHPHFLQNRCFANRGWDEENRRICERNGIVYQGFSLLTANPEVVHAPQVAAIAARHEITAAQTVFSFVRQLGILPLTGTSDPLHMKQDLRSLEITLSTQEIAEIESIASNRRY